RTVQPTSPGTASIAVTNVFGRPSRFVRAVSSTVDRRCASSSDIARKWASPKRIRPFDVMSTDSATRMTTRTRSSPRRSRNRASNRAMRSGRGHTRRTHLREHVEAVLAAADLDAVEGGAGLVRQLLVEHRGDGPSGMDVSDHADEVLGEERTDEEQPDRRRGEAPCQAADRSDLRPGDEPRDEEQDGGDGEDGEHV